MKNTSSGPEESFFKKKGFFVALYSTLGAVMVLALVITFTNLTTGPEGSELAENEPVQEDSINVNTDDVTPLEQQEARRAENEQAWWRSTPKPAAALTPSPTVPPPATVATPAPAAPVAPVTPTPEQPTVEDEQSDIGEKPTPEPTVKPASSETASFTPFAEDDKMLWPLEGEIAMAFSADKLVYDPTLDQYRTNDDMRISAREGTPVKACADGQVLEIGNNHVYGTYVAIDHGNGWVSTYGQLMDGVLVDPGEVVSAGQVIGGVGQPSYFGSLNGTHVNLRVTKENEPVDPATLLAATE